MKNSDMPAMPIPNKETADLFLSGEKGNKTLGLTKREEFAKAAMQGILATGAHSCENTSHWAAMHADALLAELERTK